MNGSPSDKSPQQWSVHAELTISHPGASDPRNPPRTGTVLDEKGVRMLYSWTANESITIPTNIPWTSSVNRSPTPWSATVTPSYPTNALSPRSQPEHDRLFGFQKGNLFFTSEPPRRNPLINANIDNRLASSAYNQNRLGLNVGSNNRLGMGSNNRLAVNDSGYFSGMFSPNVAEGKNDDPAYARKCRSTCSIVLSNDPKTSQSRSQCGRTQSLRCQTPSACNDGKSDTFYGCGDPWCHHLHYGDDFSTVRRISPVKEVCEDITVSNCTCPVCDPEYNKQYYQQKAVKRDVSVQTLEMVNKCTSPLLKMEDLDRETQSSGKKIIRNKVKRGNTISSSQSSYRQELRQKFQQKSGSTNSSQVSKIINRHAVKVGLH